MLIGLTK